MDILTAYSPLSIGFNVNSLVVSSGVSGTMVTTTVGAASLRQYRDATSSETTIQALFLGKVGGHSGLDEE